MTDEEHHHLWDKVHKCKSTTVNVTVRTEALLHFLMDHQKLTGRAEEMHRIIHSGVKIGDMPPLLGTQ